MWTYTSPDHSVITDGKGTCVPCDLANADFRAFIESGIEIAPYVPPPEPVPQSISARQMRLFLLSQNLLQQVEAMIANCPPAMQIEWQYSTQFLRDSPVMIAAAEAMNITPETLDQWFITAAEL